MSTVKIDPNSGLPELPKGYLWKVGTSWTDSGPSATRFDALSLLRHRPEGFSFLVDDAKIERWKTSAVIHAEKMGNEVVTWGGVPGIIKGLPDGFSEKDILEAAIELMEKWERAQQRQRLLGVYPPNRLDLTLENTL